MTSIKKSLLLIVTWLLAFPVIAQEALDMEKASELVRNGRWTQAYEFLSPHQFSKAGDPSFDYLFGLTALEAGHASVATFAFERVLAVDPNHGAARLDMGRAYFTLGDMARARREFDLAHALDPPPAARATMARYLSEMEARENTPTTRATAYMEAGLGVDSNVTQGPSSSNVYLPVFGVSFTLDAANQKVRDNFSQVNAGADVNHRINDNVSLYGGIDAKWRGYSDVTNFNFGSADWRGGLQWQEGRDTWRAGLGYNDYHLDHQKYRKISSVSGEFRRALTDKQQFLFFGQYAQVRYAQEVQANNDVNQWVGGAGWVTQMDVSLPIMVSLSAYAGNETESDRANPRVDGDKNFFGVRAGLQISPQSDLDVYATAGLQLGKYRRTNILYDTKRTDEVYELAAGSVWRFAPAWSVKPQVSWLHNDSDLSVNDYQRYEASFFIRREFQ